MENINAIIIVFLICVTILPVAFAFGCVALAFYSFRLGLTHGTTMLAVAKVEQARLEAKKQSEKENPQSVDTMRGAAFPSFGELVRENSSK